MKKFLVRFLTMNLKKNLADEDDMPLTARNGHSEPNV